VVFVIDLELSEFMSNLTPVNCPTMCKPPNGFSLIFAYAS
jgi:hypothetical protein